MKVFLIKVLKDRGLGINNFVVLQLTVFLSLEIILQMMKLEETTMMKRLKQKSSTRK